VRNWRQPCPPKSVTDLTEMVEGKSLAEIEAMDYNDLLNLLGREVVMTRIRCATLALGTLKGAAKQYVTRQMLSEAGVE
jgi:nitrogen fixation NifU-like protein